MNNSSVRPLGPFSDFVVDMMPRLVADGQLDQAASECTRLASQAKLVCLSDQQALIASLDAKLAARLLIFSDVQVPESLVQLIEQLSDCPDVFLYEEIVMANPLEDMRTFSVGDTRDVEMAFYQHHRVIEQQLAGVTEAIKAKVNNPGTRGACVDELRDVLDQVISDTKAAGSMSGDDFAAFRGFLMSDPLTGTVGPSGLYSQGMAALYILLWGETMPVARRTFYRENINYFGSYGFEILALLDSVGRGQSVRELAKSSPKVYEPLAECLSSFFQVWGTSHSTVVKRLLPRDAMGTAGKPIAELLQETS